MGAHDLLDHHAEHELKAVEDLAGRHGVERAHERRAEARDHFAKLFDRDVLDGVAGLPVQTRDQLGQDAASVFVEEAERRLEKGPQEIFDAARSAGGCPLELLEALEPRLV